MLKSSHLSGFDRSLECLESISYFLDLTSALRAQGAEWAGINESRKERFSGGIKVNFDAPDSIKICGRT